MGAIGQATNTQHDIIGKISVNGIEQWDPVTFGRRYALVMGGCRLETHCGSQQLGHARPP